MKLSIEKVFQLAARHPEIKVLLQTAGENEEKVLKLRGQLIAWKIVVVALLFSIVGGVADVRSK